MNTECVHLVHGVWIVKYFLLCFGGWAAVAVTYMVSRRYIKDAWKEQSNQPDPDREGKMLPNPIPSTLGQGRLALGPAGLAICIALSVMAGLSDEAHRADTFIVMISLMFPTVWYSVSNFFHEVEQKRLLETTDQTKDTSKQALPAGMTSVSSADPSH